MAGTFLLLGADSPFWGPPVATSGDLPTSATDGEVRVALDTNTFYLFESGSWSTAGGGGGGSFITSVSDTDSVDLTETAGDLTADVRLSANAATAGFFKATTTIKSAGSVGLHVEAPEATAR